MGRGSDGEVKITPHTLILSMENEEKTKLHAYFGKKSSDELLKAFSKLDKDGNFKKGTFNIFKKLKKN